MTLIVKRRRLRAAVISRSGFLFPIVLVAMLAVGVSAAWSQPVAPMAPKLKPVAIDDRATVEAGRPTRIEILENDLAIPAGPTPPEIDIVQPACGTVQVDGRAVIYSGTSDCVGAEVSFKYIVKLPDDSVAAAVNVTVTATTFSCGISSMQVTSIKIEGGVFNKQNAPPAIADLVAQIDDQTFTVPTFCVTLDAVSAELVDPYFNNMPQQERDDQFPETLLNNAAGGGTDPAARVSHRMAQAFARRSSERSGRNIQLPSLNEYVAVAWELQTRRPQSPEALNFIAGLRSGALQWTSTPCAGENAFWVIGPNFQGRVEKLCFNQSRLEKTGFRLAIR
jgi:hypothetical protein